MSPISALIQACCLLAAGVVLWRLWRVATCNQPAWLRILISGGFLIRAFAGALLFWISYLQLPVERSLQLGNGFWFFGIDGRTYFGFAAEAADDGVQAILTIDETAPSIVYIKVLGFFAWMFGGVPSVALLLNLFSYLGTVTLITRWSARYNIPPRVVAIPLIAIAYLPSWILWSLQPLKDSFFCFLVILFAFALDAFHAAWRQPLGTRGRHLAASVAVLAAAAYALAGIRYYYALVAVAAAALPMLAVVAVRRPKREVLVRALVTTAAMLLMTQVVVEGGGRYVPSAIRAVLRPSVADIRRPIERIGAALGVLDRARDNIDRYSASGTRIRSGPVVVTMERPRATPKGPEPAPKHSETPGPPDVAESARPTDVPNTIRGRLVVGFAALLLPRTLSNGLGLTSIGAGRGNWWFVECDTLMFDLILIVSVAMFVRGLRRGAWRDPFAWYLVVVSVTMGASLAYAISNFGALFRHREMVVATTILLPLSAFRWPAAPRRAALVTRLQQHGAHD